MRSHVGEIYISPGIQSKLTAKHQVSQDEVRQCFDNRTGKLLEDGREDHKTDPPTQWFLAETNQQRMLKIVFVLRATDFKTTIYIRTAYEPSPEEIRIYEKYGKT